MKPVHNSAHQALTAAKRSLVKGNRTDARKWALRAVALAPEWIDAWLLLAAADTPDASIKHIERALQINPNSLPAQKALLWARERKKEQRDESSIIDTVQITIARKKVNNPIPKAVANRRPFQILITLLITSLLVIWGYYSTLSAKAIPIENYTSNLQVQKITRTPTNTKTPAATATTLPSVTPTNIPTLVLTPTSPPTPIAEPITEPKTTSKKKDKKKKPGNQAVPSTSRPSGIGEKEAWIEVDLSSQRSYAYIGDQHVKTFVVSTGTWLHPTVTGKFRVYVKYRYANMTGPGYFLPDVPNVMYFYKDYGIHGTYWHNNFGTPMSHGCINYSIKDSKWIFDFASVGTLVYIHK